MTTTLTHRLVVTEVDRIADIGRTDWDGLTTELSLYSSYLWLDYVERYGDCAPRYLLVHDGDRLVGALPTYEFTDTMPHFYRPETLIPEVGSIRPVLLGGTRLGYTSEFLLDPTLDDAIRSTVVGLLLDRLRAMPAGLTALLYLTDSALELALPLLAGTDLVFALDARARLLVDQSGLDGYRSVSGPNVRGRMRKEMRRFSDAGCRVEVLRLSECHQHLGSLAAQVLQRYGQDITAETISDRLETQVATLDDLCHVIVARQGQRIVGFTQFFAWNGVLYGRMHGVDDSMARTAALYYNLTYYHAIKFAAANGYQALDLGCDSYEAKVRRGAYLEPLWGLLLQPSLTRSTIDLLRTRSHAKLNDLTAWDPGVRTPTAQRIAATDT